MAIRVKDKQTNISLSFTSRLRVSSSTSGSHRRFIILRRSIHLRNLEFSDLRVKTVSKVRFTTHFSDSQKNWRKRPWLWWMFIVSLSQSLAMLGVLITPVCFNLSDFEILLCLFLCFSFIYRLVFGKMRKELWVTEARDTDHVFLIMNIEKMSF